MSTERLHGKYVRVGKLITTVISVEIIFTPGEEFEPAQALKHADPTFLEPWFWTVGLENSSANIK
ncbi:MAG: hypothetical protein DMF61_11500 [Blastocatellia bacterium AA13]|nr:MAG: hypothetical protein DMF61_11500 [Blastocatellia bacterium AA13]